MGLNYDQIDDAVLLTQQEFIKKGAFVNMQTDLTDHVAVREMWKDRKKVFQGGHPWRFDVQVDHNHSARTVGLYENDGSSINDTMIKGEVTPRHVNAHYLYDVREPDFQRGGAAIVDLVKTRYTAMMVSLYELLETLLWNKPVDSSNTKDPYGVAFWVTRSDQEGFFGKNPAGFSDGRAGISTDNYPRWANYTARYAEISKEDLIRKMRRASRRIAFRSVVSHAEPVVGGMKNGIYTNDSVIGLLEEILEASNMNLGNDIASKDGRTLFKGTPIIYAPKLNEDSSDPVYMLDWKWMAIGVLAGWENSLTKPTQVAGKHTVRRVDLGGRRNIKKKNLRRQCVISK